MASSLPYIVDFCGFQIARGKRDGASICFFVFCYSKGLGHEIECKNKDITE
jgi:hypothetical protein